MTGGALAWLALAAVSALVALHALRLRRRWQETERVVADQAEKLEHVQTEFGRFAPSDVVEHLSDPTSAMAPARREVTVMFADLRAFTMLAERMDPSDLVSVLNGYFAAMTEAITAHHGRVNQLVGDGLMALFGALEPDPWQAQDAVQAALEMRAALERYNASLRERGFTPLAFGVGIHSGEAVAGVVGNRLLSTFTVVGDAVNIAARVESLTRNHGVDVLITDAVRVKLDGRYRLRAMPPTLVKGKEQPIVTYAVDGYTAGT